MSARKSRLGICVTVWAMVLILATGCGSGSDSAYDPDAPPMPEDVYRAEGPFALGALQKGEGDGFYWWEMAYGNFPHIDGDEDLWEFAEAFAQAQLNPEGILWADNRLVDMTDGGREFFVNRRGGPTEILYDAEKDIKLEMSPPNILLLSNLDQADRDDLERAGDALVYTEFARVGDAPVLIVPADFPVDGLTAEQARGLLSGELTNWESLDAGSKPVTLYHELGGMPSGAVAAIYRFLDGRPLADGVTETVSMPNGVGEGEGYTIDYSTPYSNENGSVGIELYSRAREMTEVKILPIDGASPGRDTFSSGAYPMFIGCHAVYREEDKSNAPGHFVEWLASDDGRALLESHNLIPLR